MIAAAAAAGNSAAEPAVAELPKLPVADAAAKSSRAWIYVQSVPSVVLIQNKGRRGTGFCVAGEGYVLTVRRGARRRRIG